MDERVMKFRVGVIVLAAIILTGILVLMFGSTGSMLQGGYTIYMHFDDAPGVTEGTPVRKSGILIGRVHDVRFADQGGVVVEARIDRGIKLYRNEVPEVTSSLLGGDVVIQFVQRSKTVPSEPLPPPTPPTPGDDKQGRHAPQTTLTAQKTDKSKTPAPSPDQLVQPGEYIEGAVAPSPMQFIAEMQGNMDEAIKALSSAGNEVSRLANNVNKILESNDEQINRIIGETEQAVKAFQTTMANINDVIGDEKVRENFKKMVSDLPSLFDESRETINTVRTTFEGVDRNLRNLEGLTGPLGERGDEIVTRVDRSVARLDELLGILSDFGRKLNSGQGTLGKLMSDQELYNNLSAAVRNVECVTREIKPIISDVRVFTDRIARHPEVLGIRGAIQRSPGTKWPLGGE
jgi:phospholipid/cholesterol/gamma-HCH transport system substrate-binding protein